MFKFEFDEELFRFQKNGPTFDPLFQLPPTIAAPAPQTPVYLSVLSGGWPPPVPCYCGM